MPLSDSDIGLVSPVTNRLTDADIGLVSPMSDAVQASNFNRQPGMVAHPLLTKLASLFIPQQGKGFTDVTSDIIAQAVPLKGIEGAEHIADRLSDPLNLIQNTIADLTQGRVQVPRVVGTAALPHDQSSVLRLPHYPGESPWLKQFVDFGNREGASTPTPGGVIEALGNLPRHVADMVTDPKLLGTLPALPESAIARLLMGSQAAVGAGESAENAIATGQTPGQRTTSIADMVLNLLGAKVLGEPSKIAPSGLSASDVTPHPFDPSIHMGNSGQDQTGVMVDPRRMLEPPGVSDARVRAQDMQAQAIRLQQPDRQLPEVATDNKGIEARARAQQTLDDAAIGLTPDRVGFVGGTRGIANAGDLTAKDQLVRPAALIPERTQGTEEALSRVEARLNRIEQAVRGPEYGKGQMELKAPEGSSQVVAPFEEAGGQLGGLRPAVRTMGGGVVEGREGESHNGIIERAGLKIQDIDSRAFVDEGGKVLTREEAAEKTGLPMSEPGRLHSEDLQGYGSTLGEKGHFEPSRGAPSERYSGVPIPKSEEFKKWFGKSVVINKDTKEPLVVYHGSPSHLAEKINEFKPTSWFTDNHELASRHADWSKGAIIPSFISLKNPLIVDGKQINKSTRYVEAQNLTVQQKGFYIKQAKKQGRDGVIFKGFHDFGFDGSPKKIKTTTGEEYDYPGVNQYVVFNPKDVKSAIGNRGTYNPTSSDIRYSGVPLPKELTDHVKKLASMLHGKFPDPKTLPDHPRRIEPKTPTPLEKTLTSARTTPLESREVYRSQPGEKLSAVDSLRNSVNEKINTAVKLDKVLLPVDAIFDRLDGNKGNYNGWLFKNVRAPIDRAVNEEFGIRAQAVKPVMDLIKKYKLNQQSGERIGVYAHLQQEGGRERLLASGVTEGTLSRIVQGITPEEKEVYNLMRANMDQTLPTIQSVMKELYGQDVKPVKNYFPMPRDYQVYQPEPSALAKGEFDDHGTWRQLQGDFEPAGAKTEQGFTVTRKPGSKTAIKVNAFDIYHQHMADVAHLLATQKPLFEIAKTVRRDMFKEKYGDMGQDMVLDWLNTVARQGRSGKQFAWLDALRNNTSKAIVGFRLASQVVHVANIPLSMQRAGVINWSRGLSHALRDSADGFMQNHFREVYERGGGEPSLVDVSQGKGAGWAFGIQRAVDRLNTQATVLGVYIGELEKKGLNGDAFAELPYDEDAGAKALTLARRAVASPLYKDIPPALARGGSLGKVFFQFQNTFLDQWSNIRHDLAAVGIAQMDLPKAVQMTVALSAMVMIESGIKFGVQQGLVAATGGQPKGSDEYWNRVAEDSLHRIPGMGQLMSEVMYGETGIPTVDVAVGAVKSGIETVDGKRIQGFPNAKPSDKVREQSAIKLLSATAELAGVPGTSQATEVIQDALKAREQGDGEVGGGGGGGGGGSKKRKKGYSVIVPNQSK